MANTETPKEPEDPEEPEIAAESQEPQEPRKPRGSRTAQKPQRTQKSQQSGSGHHEGHQAPARPRPMEVLREARAQFGELTGLAPESVTSFERTGDGWSLELEVLELARVPDTMSLMASYEVALDPEGQLTGYRRLSRYERGRSDARKSGGR
ncbi:gas vesicle protein [Streptomyces andamanensis]|uniref:Gas vesicle protein n=1 Tax=Streptomyces andamanensis TaxID=1565035 RepID=A0ABV8TFX7_9ACTN